MTRRFLHARVAMTSFPVSRKTLELENCARYMVSYYRTLIASRGRPFNKTTSRLHPMLSSCQVVMTPFPVWRKTLITPERYETDERLLKMQMVIPGRPFRKTTSRLHPMLLHAKVVLTSFLGAENAYNSRMVQNRPTVMIEC